LLQHRLPFEKRQNADILAVQVEQIKRDEDALSLAEEQSAEVRPAGVIEAGDLTIEHGVLDAQVFGEPRREFSAATKDVSIPRNQLASTVCDVSERPEAVDLQFVDEVVGVERLGAAGEPDGAQVSGQHAGIISRILTVGAWHRIDRCHTWMVYR